MHRTELDVDATNSRASHVYVKVGFVREGLHRERIWKEGEWVDVVEMGLLKEEWFQRKER